MVIDWNSFTANEWNGFTAAEWYGFVPVATYDSFAIFTDAKQLFFQNTITSTFTATAAQAIIEKRAKNTIFRSAVEKLTWTDH